MVRAKFRCLDTSASWSGVRTAILKPVTPKSVYDNGTPEEAEENRRFWSASPSGECTLRYRGDMPFVPGSYYYVDMELGLLRRETGSGVSPLFTSGTATWKFA